MAPDFCPYCETEYRAGARFCDRCGAPLPPPEPSEADSRPRTLPESLLRPKGSGARPTDLPELPSGWGSSKAGASASPEPPVRADPQVEPDSPPEINAGDAGPVGVGWRPAASASYPAVPELAERGVARSSRPLRQAAGNVIVGHVRGLSEKPARDFTVYSFRVESYDEQGNRLSPVTVEMQGIGFEGSLNEGDEVEIRKKYRPGRTIKVSQLYNITAASPFKAREYPFFIRILSYPLTLIGWLLTVAFIIGFIYLLVSCARVLLE
jgi:hypothetical protein